MGFWCRKGIRKMKKIILALMIVMVAASFAVADTIYLRDGRTIQGTVLGFINGRFVVRVDSRQSNFPRATTDPNVARDRAYDRDILYFRPEEVERIEIEGRTMDDSRVETVQVTLESNWIDTGVDLHRSDHIQINASGVITVRSEEHTSELQSQSNLVCRLLLEKKKPHLYPNLPYAADRYFAPIAQLVGVNAMLVAGAPEASCPLAAFIQSAEG